VCREFPKSCVSEAASIDTRSSVPERCKERSGIRSLAVRRLHGSSHRRFHFISTSPDQSLRKEISALFEALHALIGQRVPLHIWGACGVGKSQIVAQVASEMNWQFLDVRAVQLDPVDLRGLPRISAEQAEWVPPKSCPRAEKAYSFWMS
jgi:MoxR-like ATPase